jgi:hypothetical protein
MDVGTGSVDSLENWKGDALRENLSDLLPIQTIEISLFHKPSTIST